MLNKPFDKNSHFLYYTPEEKTSGLFFRLLEWCYPLNVNYKTIKLDFKGAPCTREGNL